MSDTKQDASEIAADDIKSKEGLGEYEIQYQVKAGEVFRPGDILTIMPLIRNEVGSIATKEKASGGQLNFNYRSIHTVMKIVAPILSKHGVTVTTAIDSDGHQLRQFERKTANGVKSACHAKVTVRLYWIAPDGSFVTSCGAGEGIDSLSDFASDKAMSYAVKQAIIYGVFIPTDGMPDPHGSDSAAGDEDSKALLMAKRMLADAVTVDAVTALGNRFGANAKGAFSPEEKDLLTMMAQTKLDQMNA